jgi:ABC-type uncharacterized transport system substrate-binding protein
VRRRDFISLVAGAAAIWPLAARAQQSTSTIRRIGVLVPESRPAAEARGLLGAFRQRLKELGWVEGQNIAFEYRSADGKEDELPKIAAELVQLNKFDSAFATVAAVRADSLVVLPDPMFFGQHDRIVALTAASHLPALFPEKEVVEAGGLMAYGPSVPASFQRAAAYVDKILRGANPADLPVEQPTKFEFVINLKTAKALGLAVPQTLLVAADEVIK